MSMDQLSESLKSLSEARESFNTLSLYNEIFSDYTKLLKQKMRMQKITLRCHTSHTRHG